MLPKPERCKGCELYTLGKGFMQPTGSGRSGIVLIGESLGDKEVGKGEPFVGPAGHTLNQALQRAGIDRAHLLITNAVQCQPPDNKLTGKPWFPAIQSCAGRHLYPQLNIWRKEKKAKVLVPMGNVPLSSVEYKAWGIDDWRGYPFWSERFQCWVLPTYHPSYIMRGNWNLEAVLIHDLQRAEEIAQRGHRPRWGKYLLDPTPADALRWVEGQLEQSECIVSYDIETPMKGEKEAEADTGDASYEILRVSFSMQDYTGMSIPWSGPYMPAIKRALENDHPKVGWNSKLYDDPRIEFNGVSIGGDRHDGMVAWHVLHSDLDKNLGFVATFTCPDQPRWKHLSHEMPAFYNAVDSDVARRAFLRTLEELKRA